MLVATFTLAITDIASANTEDVCFDNLIKADMCQKASELQAEISPMLPQKISKKIELKSIMAAKNTLIANVVLQYPKSVLDNAIQNGVGTAANVKSNMSQMTNQIVCSSPATAAFVGLGGSVRYIYNFIDGQYYMTAEVNKGDCKN